MDTDSIKQSAELIAAGGLSITLLKKGDIGVLKEPFIYKYSNSEIIIFPYKIHGTPYYLETLGLQEHILQLDRALSISRSSYVQTAYRALKKEWSAIFISERSSLPEG